jgi:hypothetical protein
LLVSDGQGVWRALLLHSELVRVRLRLLHLLLVIGRQVAHAVEVFFICLVPYLYVILLFIKKVFVTSDKLSLLHIINVLLHLL